MIAEKMLTGVAMIVLATGCAASGGRRGGMMVGAMGWSKGPSVVRRPRPWSTVPWNMVP